MKDEGLSKLKRPSTPKELVAWMNNLSMRIGTKLIHAYRPPHIVCFVMKNGKETDLTILNN